MAGYTVVNLKSDVEDMAPRGGLSPQMESRFARRALELEKSGLSYYKVAPGFRLPFGHRHGEQEEVYVILSGSARMKLDDDIVELRQWDAVRVPGEITRGFEAGDDGTEILAFGAPNTGERGRRGGAGVVDGLESRGQRAEGRPRPSCRN
jgi:mannose-6-phosphate isomerase-like protein (cupin superfamily)